MFYDVSFTVPAGRALATPYEVDVKLCRGVIQRVEIGFPSGCVGMVHLRIRQALHQLWPNNPQGSFNANGYTIAFDDHLELFNAPYILTLVGWSPGTTYPHTLEVRFGIQPMPLPERVETAASAANKLLQKLQRAL